MAMFKKMAAAAAAAAVVFSFSAAADAAQTLRVGSLTVYAPFEYVNSQNGEYEGFDMDLIRETDAEKGRCADYFHDARRSRAGAGERQH